MSVSSSPSLPAGISVVVPVYNSAAILPDLVKRLEPVLSATSGPFELILVNDGSRDDGRLPLPGVHRGHFLRGAAFRAGDYR
jgi:hypothetical protein